MFNRFFACFFLSFAVKIFNNEINPSLTPIYEETNTFFPEFNAF